MTKPDSEIRISQESLDFLKQAGYGNASILVSPSTAWDGRSSWPALVSASGKEADDFAELLDLEPRQAC